MPASAWHTSNAQWLEWIESDANVDHPVWVSCDEFDEDLRTMLERFPFLGGLDTTSVSIVPGPLPGEQRAPDPGFDSMTTLIRQTPSAGDDAGEGDEESTIDTTLEAAQTMVRGRMPDDAGELEVGIAAPESGLEIGLESPQGGELDGLYIPTLTRTQPETPARTGDTLPPVGSTTSSGTVVQPSPLRATDGGTVIAAGAPTAADVVAYARQYGYAPSERSGTPPYGPQVMVPATYSPGGYGTETHEPSPAAEPPMSAYGSDAMARGEDAYAQHPGYADFPPTPDARVDVPADEAPSHADPDGATARGSGPPPPPPFGEPGPSSRGRTLESTMDTPPAIDLASARAQAYDDDDLDADEPVDDRSAASSQTAGEIVTGFDAAESLHDGTLDDVLAEDEPPMPRKIVVVDSVAQAPLSEEELDPADILDADTPPPRPPVPAEPVAPSEPPPIKEPPAAAKSPPPIAPKGPPPAPRAVRKNDAPRGETAAALSQLAVEREGGASLFERTATPTGAWYEDTFGDQYAALTRAGHPAEAKAEIDFFLACTGLQPGASVLDVGCGDGAHAIVLAQRGYAVTGFDASLSQLLRATQANESLGAGVRFLSGDMREPPVEGPFDGILCVGTTFGYFDDDENRKVIRKLRDRLAIGGRMLLQVFNRDHVVARLPARSWWQGHGCLVLDEADMNYFTNRLQVRRTIVFEDGRQFEHDISVRAYTAHDLGSACVDAGLRVLEISGSRLTRGRFYGATSPEIWLLVERT